MDEPAALDVLAAHQGAVARGEVLEDGAVLSKHQARVVRGHSRITLRRQGYVVGGIATEGQAFSREVEGVAHRRDVGRRDAPALLHFSRHAPSS